jgi:phosphatidylglycerophosphatase A
MHRVVASFFGSGLILRRVRGDDAGSGTLASLIGFPLSLWIGSALGWPAQAIGAFVIALTAFWSVRALVDDEGDAGWIVIDEVLGVFVATVGLLGWPSVIAFVVFRVADITKGPFPGVRHVDEMAGTFGIVADDAIAGLYGLAAGHLVRALFF